MPNAWDELKLLQDTFMKIWNMYVSWFTWSLGANLLAISWIISSKSEPRPELIMGLGVVMTLALALSIIGCFWARKFFDDMEARGKSLMAQAEGVSVHLIFGGALSRSVSWLIPATLLIVLIAWVLVVIKYGH